MAEYKISYSELRLFIEESIAKKQGDKQELITHIPEILTALTGAFSDDISENRKEQEQLMEMWSNQQEEKSQFLLGKRYIRIQDRMMDFIEIFLTSGVCDLIIGCTNDIPIESMLTISTLSSVVFTLVNSFRKAASLDDFDFCLYMQAMTHFSEKKEFRKEDILRWYPIERNCNMHNDKWVCCHKVNDMCKLNFEKIEKIIESLQEKDILISRYEGDEKIYRFGR